MSRIRKSDVFDPNDFHYHAIVGAIYQSMLKHDAGIKGFRFGKKQERLDAALLERSPNKKATMAFFRKVLSRAFATATTMLHKSKLVNERTGDLTKAGREKSRLRYHGAYIGSDSKHRGYDELVNSRQSYEETLGIVRKQFYRVTEEPTVYGYRFFVWPLPPGERIPGPGAENRESAEYLARYLNKVTDPRKTRIWHVPDCSYGRSELKHWIPPDAVFHTR